MASRAECFPEAWPVRDEQRGRAQNVDMVLVRRAQAGDQLAFREIVERYQGTVFATIHRILHDANEAEDVAQEVFASAFFAIQRFRCEASLGSWLYRIAVNECYEYLRRKRSRPLVYEHDLEENDGRTFEVRSAAPSIDRTASDRDYIVKLLSKLSEQERTLLIMREVEGRSVRELCEYSGLNENTLKVRLFRIRRKLLKTAIGRRGSRAAPRPQARYATA